MTQTLSQSCARRRSARNAGLRTTNPVLRGGGRQLRPPVPPPVLDVRERAVASGRCRRRARRAGRRAGRRSGRRERTAPDGAACGDDSDCEGGHCRNEICCASGDCCRSAEDCGADEGSIAACDDEHACQGSRGEAICVVFRCRVRQGVEDDSGCGASIEADDCGLYDAVFCTGEADQDQPKCPDRCADDSQCDKKAHCTAAKCVVNVPDGGACVMGNECASNHCANGICCADGDCCKTAEICDVAKYTSPPTCDEPAGCQGSHGAPACEDNRCVSARVDDDSGCDRTVVASACGDGPDVKCLGGTEQGPPPPCATGTCGGGFRATSTCNGEAFCYDGKCIPDQPNGEGCTDDGACQSGHCQNNVCCSDGDCCENDSQCPAIKMCTDAKMCQGERQDRTCDTRSGTCTNLGDPVADDSGCSQMPTGLNCGLNIAEPCSASEEQTPPVSPSGCIPCTSVPACTVGTYRAGGCVTCRLFAQPSGPGNNNPAPVYSCEPSGGTVYQIAVGCSPLATACSVGVCR
jgi:hypothetical protein